MTACAVRIDVLTTATPKGAAFSVRTTKTGTTTTA